MKEYPSIARSDKAPVGEQCVAFYKYDGSNLRFEWSMNQGWYKFGTRHRLFDKTDSDYGSAVPLFMGKIAPQLDEVFKREFKKIKMMTVFMEFFGPSSFAGQHLLTEEKELRLIDVCPYKKCMVNPHDFIKMFGHLDFSAEVIYKGVLTEQFINDVRSGKYPVVEGVVCKGGDRHKLWMAKIKTDSYRQRLKEIFKNGWQFYWE